jgi:hypothetical protein
MPMSRSAQVSWRLSSGYRGVVCQLTDRLDESVLQANTHVEVIPTVAVGVDNIDVPGARRLGITVTNTPDVLTETTADLTFALMLGGCAPAARSGQLCSSRVVDLLKVVAVTVDAELRVFSDMDGVGMRRWVGACHDLVRRMRASPKPLLAAVHGTAVGGDLEIVLHCDVRFAADTARLGQPEIRIGFIPPVGATQALARLLGRSRALRFLYDGTLLSGGEAHAIGLVDVGRGPVHRTPGGGSARRDGGVPPGCGRLPRQATTGLAGPTEG